ncbi:helix-turn-helix domain-containing protein [Phytoactinopolyspora mesophila]|uniref:Helix-turn-helix domain-containing protein n=1 Tax=Phytoactinopolyspora mesophila TaxID=2650750 RepID=A0A7K3M9M9_9ACTN|nr:helix-turn-helix domain-containing protein [Phytoactinopolyspora mesophila]NDL59118.1 helix-turn-helix domain-containing protein [Phytoactinopolyspora mesophila]
MALTFRNLTITPDSPVNEWGVEGILAAIDRGGIDDWQRVAAEVIAHPHGSVADDLAVAIELAESTSSAAVLRSVLVHARETPRQRVARRVREAIRRSGATQAEFAERLGTSASRLSTYATGKVVPSAVMLERIEHLAHQAGAA